MMSKNEKRVELVLSIFKGENFVSKKPNGYKLQITATIGKQQMESGCIPLVSTDSEPQFNSQLAWSFSDQEWRTLRSQREAMKVCCMLISEKSERSSVLGYCVLYVKDAFLLRHFNEIDPSNANTSPLLGLKDPWKMCNPKLRLLLHFEDSSLVPECPKSPLKSDNRPVRNHESPKGKLKSRGITQREPAINTSLATDFPIDASINVGINEYPFQVNIDSGYFELGPVSEDDDLYTLNITIISGNNLHMLAPETAQTSVWLVEYKAYGCVINSDPFELTLEDETSRTFIGDKSTARIRANAVVFWNYIKSTSLEFQLLRFDKDSEVKKEVMGIGFVDLADLASPNIRQLRYTLELVSDNDDRYQGNKPEVKVMVELESVPSFFSKRKEAEDVEKLRTKNSPPNQNESQRFENLKELQENVSVDLFATCDSEGDLEQNISQSLFSREALSENKAVENPNIIQALSEQMDNIELNNFRPSPLKKALPSDDHSKSTEIRKGNSNPKLDLQGGSNKDITTKSSQQNVKHSFQTENDGSESTSSSRDRNKENQSPGTESCATTSDQPNARLEINGREMVTVQPGSYRISITLYHMWLKSRHELNDKFQLSYTHPPLSIITPIKSTAEWDASLACPNRSDRRCFAMKDGNYELTVVIPSFSEDLLGEPLKIILERSTKKNPSFSYFGFSTIPLGNLFFQNAKGRKNNTRKLKDEAIVIGKTNKKVGKMEYQITLTPCDFPRTTSEQFTEHIRMIESEDVVDADAVVSNFKKGSPSADRCKKTTEEFELWKEKEEQHLKKKFLDKEKAYLTILSAEWNKREAERKKFIEEKEGELAMKRQEVEKQADVLLAKERELKEQELQLQNAARQTSVEQTYAQQESELKMKRIKDNCQSEIEALQHRNNTMNAELKSLKGKQLILEQKLEAKEEKIRSLMESRTHSPNAELQEKANRLNLENEVLRQDLRKTEKERHEFKTQAKSLLQKLNHMQAERDMELKDENENLKLQILASREQKELRKERKEIKGVCNQLKDYKESVKSKSERGRSDKVVQTQLKERNGADNEFRVRGASCDGDSLIVSSDRDALNKEITRLTKQRQSLLDSGCYNNYNRVVKEMEERILKLANRLP